MRRVKIEPKEVQLQKAVFEYLRFYRTPGLIAYHAFNEGQRAARSAEFYASIGLLAGVADICLVLPGGQAGFLELKTPSGKVELSQLSFREQCRDNGAKYAIARTVEEATTILFEWGAITENPLAKRAA